MSIRQFSPFLIACFLLIALLNMRLAASDATEQSPEKAGDSVEAKATMGQNDDGQGRSDLTAIGGRFLQAIPAVFAALIAYVVGGYFFFRASSFDSNKDLIENRNAALGIVYGAFLLATALALSGALFGRAEDHGVVAALKTLTEGLWAVCLLGLSIWVNDKLILYRFQTSKEIREDGNLGAAFCVAGSCIACGLILNGALAGFSKNFTYGLRDIGLFWLLGNAVLVVAAIVYQRITRYDVHQLIEYDNNAAVGIGFGGFLISLGIVLRAALVGSGLGLLTTEMLNTFSRALIGVIGIIIFYPIVQFLVAPRADYRDEVEMSGNAAVSAATTCALLGVAVLLAIAIQR